MNINQDIIRQAIEKWGHVKQLAMCEEECIELALEIHKVNNREANIERWEKMIDEIADVNIMIAQANMIAGEKSVQARIDFKINRLKDRLEKSQF